MENINQAESERINQTALEVDSSVCPAGSESYRVQRGDSFYLIARKFGISVRALRNANPAIAAGRLLVGDILCVPVGEGRSCPVGSSAYTVQQGQSVVDVMLSSNVSLRALREYNEDIRLTALRRAMCFACRRAATGGCAKTADLSIGFRRATHSMKLPSETERMSSRFCG